MDWWGVLELDWWGVLSHWLGVVKLDWWGVVKLDWGGEVVMLARGRSNAAEAHATREHKVYENV